MVSAQPTSAPSVPAEPPPDVRSGPLASLRSARARAVGPALIVILLIALVALPTLFDLIFGFSGAFQLHRVSLIAIFALAAFAQNILTGYAAQPSLGNAAFFGLGGYLLAWLAGDLGQPWWLAIVIAMLASALIGVIVGGPALRISGAYLAIVTLGLALIAGSLFDLWDTTAGRQSYGINNLPDLLQDDHSLYYLVLLITVVIFALGWVLLRSRVGRAWVAIRDSESAALAFGVNATYYKLLAFIVSAALTGLAGALYAIWAQTADSSMSSVDETILFLAMIVVGGLGSILGSALGALFVGFLPLLLGQLPSPINVAGLSVQVSTLTTGIYGLLLLLALIFFPAGLASIREWLTALLARVGRPGSTAQQGGGAA
ncbi:MAG TPA: branched-chain amino acid ABC transporter permease [Ktedonobacterales bacterium]|jgi:branched-chain amino acid transport system permease protein|nr:branched-chain amino acid ABC transporter permease [Ktedonobacterales bacterium]